MLTPLKLHKTFIILVLFQITLFHCHFENKEDYERRKAFYSQVTDISSGAIGLLETKKAGLSCVANKEIEKFKVVFKIPKK